MSVEAITWALRQEIPRSSAKFVLVVLANCASGDTFLAWPSVAYVADATSQDRKTVLANLRKLVAWGCIEDTGKRRGATKQILVYRLRCAPRTPAGNVSRKENNSENGTGPKVEVTNTVFLREESQNGDTETSGTAKNPTTCGSRSAEHSVVVKLIEGARLDRKTKQDLHDEFNARLANNPPASPVSWACALIKRAERGEFVPDAGIALAARRRERSAREHEAALRRQEALDHESRARSPEARAAADAALQELRTKLWGQS